MSFGRIMLPVLAAAALIAPLVLAIPASAATNFYLVADNGAGYAIVDAGHGQLAEMGGRFTYFHWVNESSGYGELVDNAGLCLLIGSDDNAYFESCQNTTPERFMDSGGWIKNQHTALYLGTTDVSGSTLFETGGRTTLNQFTAPGA